MDSGRPGSFEMQVALESLQQQLEQAAKQHAAELTAMSAKHQSSKADLLETVAQLQAALDQANSGQAHVAALELQLQQQVTATQAAVNEFEAQRDQAQAASQQASDQLHALRTEHEAQLTHITAQQQAAAALTTQQASSLQQHSELLVAQASQLECEKQALQQQVQAELARAAALEAQLEAALSQVGCLMTGRVQVGCSLRQCLGRAHFIKTFIMSLN